MDTAVLMQILKPIIVAVLTGVATVLGIYIKKIGVYVIDWFKSKTTSTVYNQALEMAQGLYIYLEDKYGESLKKMGAVKKAEMDSMLLEKFPSLTQVELDAINKTVWVSFQEGFNGTYSNKSEANLKRING